MKVHLSDHPRWEKGIKISFDYNPLYVEQIKQVLGTNWHPKTKSENGYWEATGPEVLLEFQRFGIQVASMSTGVRKICEQFRQEVWDALDARMLPIDQEPWGYQKAGAKFLAAMPNSILADDMGTGKSKQSLDAFCLEQYESALILCNKTACFNWENEVRKWYPNLPVAVVPDGGKKARSAFWKAPPAIVIANYELAIQADWPRDRQWDAFIADEATRFKNSSTRTWKAVKQIAAKSKTLWALTGTPLEKNLEEYYNIMAAVRPAVLGNFVRFRNQHMDIDKWSGRVKGVKHLDVLQERVGPFMLRRTKDEVQKALPPKVYQEVYVKLSDPEKEAYDSFTDDFDNWLTKHGVSGGGDPITQTIRMRQFTCTPMIFSNDLGMGSKYDALKYQIDGWEGRVVIFCFFKEVIKLLHQKLGAHPDALITGDVQGSEERFRRCEAFNAGQLGKVFLSTDAGNQSINLYGADLIVHYDQIFNPQKMHQREDRLHRIGQQGTVHVMSLLCLNTVDVGMFEQNKREEKLFKEVIDGAEYSLLERLDAPRWKNIVRGRS